MSPNFPAPDDAHMDACGVSARVFMTRLTVVFIVVAMVVSAAVLAVPRAARADIVAAVPDTWSPAQVRHGTYEDEAAAAERPARTTRTQAAVAGAPDAPTWLAPGYGFRYDYTRKLSVRYSDPQGDRGTVTFTIYNTAGKVMRTLTSPRVPDGEIASVEPGATSLPSDWYYAFARANDGTATSPRSLIRRFEVSASPSGTPGLGSKPFYSFEDFPLADRAQLQVNLANGNLLHRSKDLAIRGTAGHDQVLERVYNSQQTSVRSAGRGWSVGPGQQYALYHARGNGGQDLVFEDESQARWRLTYKAGQWTAPPGLNVKVVDTDQGWDLVYRDTKRRLDFDDSGRLERILDRSGNIIDLESYATNQVVHRLVDTQNRVTTLRVDDKTRRLEGITDPAGRSTSYTYTGDNLTRATDLTGKTWTYQYANNKLTQITDPRGNTTRISYTTDQKVASIVRVTDPAKGTGPTTRFAYHAAGNCPQSKITSACTVVTDPNGHATTSGYDSQGRVTKVYDALGHKRETSYDSRGNVTSLTGDGGGTTGPATKIGYVTGTDKVASVDSAEGGKSTFTYGDPSVDSPTKYTTPQGTSLSYTYRKGDGNLTSIRTANGGEDRYRAAHNDDGTLKSYSEPNLTTSAKTDRVTTSLGYTKGNLTRLDLPAPLGDLTFTVDAYGRRTSQTDGMGRTTRYAYDGLDRLTKVTSPSGSTIVYSYDANGNQVRRTVTGAGANADGTTTYTYDALNRITSEVKPGGSRTDTSYDAAGNLRTLRIPAGTTTYGYNAANLLTKLTEPGGASTTYGYDSDNNRTHVSYPNGVTVTSTYNRSNAVKRIRATKGSSVYSNLTYAYDKDGNGKDDMSLRSKVTDGVRHETTSYTYDSSYSQLTKAQTKNDAGTAVQTYSYDYDANGHRTKSSHNSSTMTYSYNAAGQMTKMGTTGIRYDANGNQLNSGDTTVTYNDRDQATTFGGTSTAYEDKDQAQRSKLGNRAFLNTPLGVSSYTDPGAKTTNVLREPNGQLAALRQPTGAASYPITDALGSVIALTDAKGTKTDTYTYEPYGASQSRTGTTANPFQFTGEYRDSKSLDKIGKRYYQPGTGQWTQIDPMRRATNPTNPPEASPYLYVGNNPTNYTDPTGMYSWSTLFSDIANGAQAGAGFGAIGGCVVAGTMTGGIGCLGGAGVGAVWGGMAGTVIGTAVGIFDAIE